MGETSPASATTAAVPTDTDRDEAARALWPLARYRWPRPDELSEHAAGQWQRVAQLVAEARAAERSRLATGAEINADDRARADRVLAAIDPHALLSPISASERIAWALAETRAAAYAAGLEEGADDAHASGYAEGVGRCGRSLPTLDDYTPGTVCTLPAGHEGWHRSDNGAEWGMRS